MRSIRKRIRGLLILVCLIIFIFSGYQVFDYWKNSQDNRNLTDELIAEAVEIKTAVPESGAEDEASAEGTDSEEAGAMGSEEIGSGQTEASSAEVVQKETAPIEVDFEALWEENEDVVAWIYSPDTPIHYPIAQSEDNDYYLHRLLNGKYNFAGTIFVDYRNQPDFSDWNTIIYGHNMKNDTMFGSLSEYTKQNYYDKHPVLYLLTPEKDYKIELFAGYVTEVTSVVYAVLTTEEEKQALAESSFKKSNFLSDVQVQPEDRLVTLSTCTNSDDARYVLMGILRELSR